jgi:hypothetical protein
MTAESAANPGTCWWMRAEHVAIVVVGSVLALLHWQEIAWIRFIAAFVLIDLVGYLPGAIAVRRANRERIAPVFHLLYNIAHNYVFAGSAVAAWWLLGGGPEWAMLAVPIHLSGDRGLLGNFSKPATLPFEPVHGSRREEPAS